MSWSDGHRSWFSRARAGAGAVLFLLLALGAEGDVATHSNTNNAVRAVANDNGAGFLYSRWIDERDVFAVAADDSDTDTGTPAIQKPGSFWRDVADGVRERAWRRVRGLAALPVPNDGDDAVGVDEWFAAERRRLRGVVGGAPAAFVGDVERAVAGALSGHAVERLAFVKRARVDFRTSIGDRQGSGGVDAAGALREAENEVLGWQLRAYLGEASSSKGGNAGLFYRWVVEDARLLGLNAFLDYEDTDKGDFWRWSLGGSWKSRLLFADINKYWAITDPVIISEESQVYTRDGFDADIAVRVPYTEWAKVRVGYFSWQGQFGDADVRGVRAGVDVNPGSGFELGVEYDGESGDFGGNVSYTHNFGRPGASARRAGAFDPRAHFFDAVRREYSQRIVAKGEAGSANALVVNAGVDIIVKGQVSLTSTITANTVTIAATNAANTEIELTGSVDIAAANPGGAVAGLLLRQKGGGWSLTMAAGSEIGFDLTSRLLRILRGSGEFNRIRGDTPGTVIFNGATVILLGTRFKFGHSGGGKAEVSLLAGGLAMRADDMNLVSVKVAGRASVEMRDNAGNAIMTVGCGLGLTMTAGANALGCVGRGADYTQATTPASVTLRDGRVWVPFGARVVVARFAVSMVAAESSLSASVPAGYALVSMTAGGVASYDLRLAAAADIAGEKRPRIIITDASEFVSNITADFTVRVAERLSVLVMPPRARMVTITQNITAGAGDLPRVAGIGGLPAYSLALRGDFAANFNVENGAINNTRQINIASGVRELIVEATDALATRASVTIMVQMLPTPPLVIISPQEGYAAVAATTTVGVEAAVVGAVGGVLPYLHDFNIGGGWVTTAAIPQNIGGGNITLDDGGRLLVQGNRNSVEFDLTLRVRDSAAANQQTQTRPIKVSLSEGLVLQLNDLASGARVTTYGARMTLGTVAAQSQANIGSFRLLAGGGGNFIQVLNIGGEDRAQVIYRGFRGAATTTRISLVINDDSGGSPTPDMATASFELRVVDPPELTIGFDGAFNTTPVTVGASDEINIGRIVLDGGLNPRDPSIISGGAFRLDGGADRSDGAVNLIVRANALNARARMITAIIRGDDGHPNTRAQTMTVAVMIVERVNLLGGGRFTVFAVNAAAYTITTFRPVGGTPDADTGYGDQTNVNNPSAPGVARTGSGETVHLVRNTTNENAGASYEFIQRINDTRDTVEATAEITVIASLAAAMQFAGGALDTGVETTVATLGASGGVGDYTFSANNNAVSFVEGTIAVARLNNVGTVNIDLIADDDNAPITEPVTFGITLTALRPFAIRPLVITLTTATRTPARASDSPWRIIAEGGQPPFAYNFEAGTQNVPFMGNTGENGELQWTGHLLPSAPGTVISEVMSAADNSAPRRGARLPVTIVYVLPPRVRANIQLRTRAAETGASVTVAALTYSGGAAGGNLTASVEVSNGAAEIDNNNVVWAGASGGDATVFVHAYQQDNDTAPQSTATVVVNFVAPLTLVFGGGYESAPLTSAAAITIGTLQISGGNGNYGNPSFAANQRDFVFVEGTIVVLNNNSQRNQSERTVTAVIRADDTGNNSHISAPASISVTVNVVDAVKWNGGGRFTVFSGRASDIHPIVTIKPIGGITPYANFAQTPASAPSGFVVNRNTQTHEVTISRSPAGAVQINAGDAHSITFSITDDNGNGGTTATVVIITVIDALAAGVDFAGGALETGVTATVATISASGGVGDYTFTESHARVSIVDATIVVADFNNVATTDFEIIVDDDNAPITEPITFSIGLTALTPLTAPMIEVTVTAKANPGATPNTPAATMLPSGGQPPYSYWFSPGGNAPTQGSDNLVVPDAVLYYIRRSSVLLFFNLQAGVSRTVAGARAQTDFFVVRDSSTPFRELTLAATVHVVLPPSVTIANLNQTVRRYKNGVSVRIASPSFSGGAAAAGLTASVVGFESGVTALITNNTVVVSANAGVTASRQITIAAYDSANNTAPAATVSLSVHFVNPLRFANVPTEVITLTTHDARVQANAIAEGAQFPLFITLQGGNGGYTYNPPIGTPVPPVFGVQWHIPVHRPDGLLRFGSQNAAPMTLPVRLLGRDAEIDGYSQEIALSDQVLITIVFVDPPQMSWGFFGDYQGSFMTVDGQLTELTIATLTVGGGLNPQDPLRPGASADEFEYIFDGRYDGSVVVRMTDADRVRTATARVRVTDPHPNVNNLDFNFYVTLGGPLRVERNVAVQVTLGTNPAGPRFLNSPYNVADLIPAFTVQAMGGIPPYRYLISVQGATEPNQPSEQFFQPGRVLMYYRNSPTLYFIPWGPDPLWFDAQANERQNDYFFVADSSTPPQTVRVPVNVRFIRAPETVVSGTVSLDISVTMSSPAAGVSARIATLEYTGGSYYTGGELNPAHKGVVDSGPAVVDNDTNELIISVRHAGVYTIVVIGYDSNPIAPESVQDRVSVVITAVPGQMKAAQPIAVTVIEGTTPGSATDTPAFTLTVENGLPPYRFAYYLNGNSFDSANATFTRNNVLRFEGGTRKSVLFYLRGAVGAPNPGAERETAQMLVRDSSTPTANSVLIDVSVFIVPVQPVTLSVDVILPSRLVKAPSVVVASVFGSGGGLAQAQYGASVLGVSHANGGAHIMGNDVIMSSGVAGDLIATVLGYDNNNAAARTATVQVTVNFTLAADIVLNISQSIFLTATGPTITVATLQINGGLGASGNLNATMLGVKDGTGTIEVASGIRHVLVSVADPTVRTTLQATIVGFDQATETELEATAIITVTMTVAPILRKLHGADARVTVTAGDPVVENAIAYELSITGGIAPYTFWHKHDYFSGNSDAAVMPGPTGGHFHVNYSDSYAFLLRVSGDTPKNVIRFDRGTCCTTIPAATANDIRGRHVIFVRDSSNPPKQIVVPVYLRIIAAE